MQEVIYIWLVVAIICFLVLLVVLWGPVPKQPLEKQSEEALFGAPRPRFDKRA